MHLLSPPIRPQHFGMCSDRCLKEVLVCGLDDSSEREGEQRKSGKSSF